MMQVTLIQRVGRHPVRVQSAGTVTRGHGLLFKIRGDRRRTPVGGRVAVRVLTVHGAHHGRGGLQRAATAVRADVVRVGGRGHVRRAGAGGHVMPRCHPLKPTVRHRVEV